MRRVLEGPASGAALAALILFAWTMPVSGSPWDELEPGLELARFHSNRASVVGDSVVTVVRVDPAQWELVAYCASANPARNWHNAAECAREHGLAVATNAGMFATDHTTHVGYMKCGEHVNSGAVNHYQSALASRPREVGVPPFHIFDLDLDDVTVGSVTESYDDVVQNLRLIKRPRENRWTQQEKMWSEAALGEDEQGRMLFIFCRSPYSMHDLNEILLELPIGLVCAQHLEGGPEAQLVVRSGGTELEMVGSYETGFNPNDDNERLWRIPNVIGVRRREE